MFISNFNKFLLAGRYILKGAPKTKNYFKNNVSVCFNRVFKIEQSTSVKGKKRVLTGIVLAIAAYWINGNANFLGSSFK